MDRSPAQPLFLWRASRRLVVLAYHELCDADLFAEQIQHLRRTMHPVSLADVVQAMRSGQTLPHRAVMVTFDDGDRSTYETALPIMREHGIPGVVFVVSGVLGTEEPFWWQEVEQLVKRGGTAPGLVPGDPEASVAGLKHLADEQRRTAIDHLRRLAPGPSVRTAQLKASELVELDASGLAIGSHTDSHPCLDQCTDEVLEAEVVAGHEALRGILGKSPIAFAYPNGNDDPRVVPVLARLGYEAAFLFDHRIGRFPPRDRYRISRVRVSSRANLDRFRILVSGLHPFVHHMVGRR